MTPGWIQLCLGLFGGLALFLLGLQMLTESLTKAAGEALQSVLSRLTTNRFMGAVTGALVTGVLNSSTVTTLLVVGFVSGGMMSLSQSVGVIMGANIGSTVTAQLLAFDLYEYSLAPVAVGFFTLLSAKREKVKHNGMMLLGIGLVFYGMGVMGEAMAPLRSYEPFLAMLEGLQRPATGILAGAVFTAVVQSSAATVGIAIAMAGEGLLTLPAGIALALGANIGTAVTTAVMGVLGSRTTEAVRASVVHVVFNVVGVLLWLPFIDVLVEIAATLSPASPELEGMARIAEDVPRQIANANTCFNVINTLLFIGFAPWFARFAQWLVPEREAAAGVIIEPEFLDEGALAAPSLALQQARLEIARLGDIVARMLRDVGPALYANDAVQLEAILHLDDQVDVLEEEILLYLGKIRQSALSSAESLELQGLMTATDSLESIADVIESDVLALARKAVSTRSGEATAHILGSSTLRLWERWSGLYTRFATMIRPPPARCLASRTASASSATA